MSHIERETLRLCEDCAMRRGNTWVESYKTTNLGLNY